MSDEIAQSSIETQSELNVTKFDTWLLLSDRVVSMNTQIPLDQVSFIGHEHSENPHKGKLLIFGSLIGLAGILWLSEGEMLGALALILAASLIVVALMSTDQYALYSTSGACLTVKIAADTETLSTFKEFSDQVVKKRTLYMGQLR